MRVNGKNLTKHKLDLIKHLEKKVVFSLKNNIKSEQNFEKEEHNNSFETL